ncbi:MAG: DUF4430 domain-containing protein [Anaerovoracaceae bacterium]
MNEKLKRQRLKKYALIALAVIVIVGTAIGFSIEGKDSKLADGQGQTVVANEGDAEKEEEKKPDEDKKVTSNQVDNLTEEQKKNTTPEEIKVDNSKDATASNEGNKALKPDNPENVTVTVEVRCDALSEHMDYLENASIKDYIPSDGVILAKTSYSGTTENTVFDALNTVCRNNDIHLDFDYTPVYESSYIKAIGFLYEFDAGPASGWMFSVNGWYPNYGCSNYYLRDGDEIVWRYTCRGYGSDIGAD